MSKPNNSIGIRLTCLGTALWLATLGWISLSYAAEQKVALVIGNSAYPVSRLRNPVNDAKAMADKLKSLGFDVILRTDSNLRDMTRAFSQFGQKLVPGSVALFYYAGHGMQVRGKNYLIPLDAEIETEGSVSTEAVDVDQLLNQLGPARLSMVILDACRNNPFERKFRSSASGGLAQIDAPTGTMLAYATAPGKVASDGNGSNGMYTEALLKALDMPGLKVEDVFKQVRINVVKASDGQQTPWESSSLTGEFYFKTPIATAVDDSALLKSERERAALAKELEEERKRRDKDAELIRVEMEKLRAELLKMRGDPPAQSNVAASAAAPPTAVATPPKPAPAPVPPTTAAIAPAPPVAAAPPTPEPPTQIALATPSTPRPAAPASFADEWARRIALLEQSKGKLTFTKALAILLDVSSSEELTALVANEQFLHAQRTPLAVALGIGPLGDLEWSAAWNFRRSHWADEAALENCEKATGSKCGVVLRDSTFDEALFMQTAKQLASQSVSAVRRLYLQTLRQPGKMFTTPLVNNGVGRVSASR